MPQSHEDASNAPSNYPLIFSCIGLLTLGFLSPASFYLSIRELRKSQVNARSILAVVLSGIGLLMLFVAAALLLVFAMGLKNYQNAVTASASASDDFQITIIGQQHFWTSVSPGLDGVIGTADDISLRNQIVIPEQTEVYLSIQSNDVIHGLFIPAARFKKDAVPGRNNRGVIDPLAIGQYDFFCTEYCGQDHSQMVGTLDVVSEKDYQAMMVQPADSTTP